MASRIGLRMQVEHGSPHAAPSHNRWPSSHWDRDDEHGVGSLLQFNLSTLCFLQLMRDQLQQEEQRERQQQHNAALQYMQQRMAGPPAPTPAISTPQHYQNMQVPIEVLKVSDSLTDS